MKKELDCRGLACPAPVLETKNAIENEQLNTITIILDNEASKQNVCRFLESQNFDVSVQRHDNDFHVTGTHRGHAAAPEVSAPEETIAEGQKIMFMLTSLTMGHGDDELGSKLLINLLKTLKEMGSDLWRLVFVNSGVHLTIEGSETYPTLRDLENDGTQILVCGTCLEHFNLLQRNKVGTTTNMLDIVTSMQLADKVIKI